MAALVYYLTFFQNCIIINIEKGDEAYEEIFMLELVLL